MKRLINWGWIRKGASVTGLLATCAIAFFVWNTHPDNSPDTLDPLHETEEIRNLRETASVLQNHLESVNERLRMKHFLVEEVLRKRIDWRIALGTYSWLCAQSQVRAKDLSLAPETTEEIEMLVDSFTEWSFVTSETESQERKCQLWNSWEIAGMDIRRIEPGISPDFLTRFQEAEKTALD